MTKTRALSCAAAVFAAGITGLASAIVLSGQTIHCLHVRGLDRDVRGSFKYDYCPRCGKTRITAYDTQGFIVYASRWQDTEAQAEADVRWWLDGPESVGLLSR